MRVWLDDIDPMPPDFDVHVRTADEAIKLLKAGKVTDISFDHDLGEGTGKEGIDVAKVIEDGAFYGTIPRTAWSIHSDNPPGTANILMAMQSAERFWAKREFNGVAESL